MLEVVPVPALSDNYIWLVHDTASGETAVVDPGEAEPVLAEAGRRGWSISQLWNTHWHPDHTGGNAEVQAATGCTISAPHSERIRHAEARLGDGDVVRIGEHRGRVLAVPGHTLDHIALIFDDDGIAFVGDTIFAMGCGRLFEGSPQQMHASLQSLVALPENTRLYCAHEYTLSNARFAAHVEPENAAIRARLGQVERLREEGAITVPTTVGEERATNPFVRVSDAEQFALVRARKDSFR